MTAYKATHNMKCRNQQYQVGKTYTYDGKPIICGKGIHYCSRMANTLNYYEYTKDFVLLEIEILGNVETKGDKSVTNKAKILRVIPKEEWDFATFDDRGNMISETYPGGYKTTYEYDERNNKISKTYPNDRKTTYKYDELIEE